MFTQYQMKNKLKVQLVESHKSPVVSIQMWVRTGSADETKGQEGISHFIEHLVFKGTRKYGVGEIAKAVEGSGGELNAFTTFDHTVFHVTMSRDDMAVGLDCIGEMMGFPKFDPIEIDKEREVVIEEIKRSADSPSRVAYQNLFSTIYKKHPYGIPVIGYAKNIKKVSPRVLKNYYSSRYVPSNMTLVVAGDFDRKEIKKEIEKIFGPFEANKLKKVKRKKDLPQKTPRLSYTNSEFKDTMLNLAFRIPGAKHKDVVALDVLGLILGQGDSSRLVRRLRLEQSLVSSVSAGSFNGADSGFFALSANLKAEDFEIVMENLEQEVGHLLSHFITHGELEKAKKNIEADEIYSLETVDGLARKVGTFQTLLNDPKYIAKYLKMVRRLQPKDLMAVARKYLKSSNMSGAIMVSKEEKNTLPKTLFSKRVKKFGKVLDKNRKTKPQKVKEDKKSKAGKILSPKLGISKESPIQKFTLASGAQVILKPNNEVPIVNVKVGFLGGLRIEDTSFLGATSLLGNSWVSGSKTLSEAQIAEQIEGCAGSISGFGGRNSIGVSLESLKLHEQTALDIFSDVVCHPTFPDEVIAREGSILKEHLRTRQDHPASVAVKTFLEELFLSHPYARDPLGTKETLEKMSGGPIRDLWQQSVAAKNAVIVAVGDIKSDKYLQFFEEMTSHMPSGKKLNETFNIDPLDQDKQFFHTMEKEQSHIIVGYRGLSFSDKDRFALQVLQAVLAGQGGRLFIELRDKKSLAYTVTPIQMPGIETGYFGVYIACSPEKGALAIEMINDEIKKLRDTKIPQYELDRAKKYLAGRNHIDLQRNGSQASSILFDEIYGIDCQETFRFAEKIRNVSSEDVRSLADRIFSQSSVKVAVGPETPW